MARRSSNSPDLGTVAFLGIAAFLFLKGKSNASQPLTQGQLRLTQTIPNSPTGPSVSITPYNAWVQQTLNQLFPEARLAVDGVIGPLTRGYIIRFQEMWMIRPDGVIGPETDYYLRSALGLPGYTDVPYGYSDVSNIQNQY